MGPAELIVILVVALIFVGPERLPKLAADIARTIREIRKYTGSLAAEFNEVIRDFEKDTAGEKSAWKEIGEGLTDAAKSVTGAVRDARAEAQGTPAAGPPAETAPLAEPSLGENEQRRRRGTVDGDRVHCSWRTARRGGIASWGGPPVRRHPPSQLKTRDDDRGPGRNRA